MFLEKIVESKKEEIRRKRTAIALREMEERISQLPNPRDVVDSISRHRPMALIAEIKRASPSAGAIKEDLDLHRISREYESGGACAISVVTEFRFFRGDLSFLSVVKGETSLPLLQKDFIIDPFQIYEGRASGADAMLLIASLLDSAQLRDFVDLVRSLHMTPLVEIHNEEDLEKIHPLDLPLVGINNRDLRTFQVDLGTTLRLKKKISSGIKVISESGIRSAQDVRVLKEAGIDGILVGEVLMRSSSPSLKIKELLET